MDFSGHLKSVQLGRRSGISQQYLPSETIIAHPPRPDRFDELNYGEVHGGDARTSLGGRELHRNGGSDVVDDQGNKSTRSLWIGRTPQDLELSKLRAIFAKYGPIQSAKIPARMRYAFVNFEKIDDAITAWRKCHDTDLLGIGEKIMIRFTSTESEAKQAKEQHSTHRTSLSGSSDHLRRGSFSKCYETQEYSGRAVWPKGPPPSGPKSQRRDISPPPLRRGDTYRPSQRNEHNRRQSQSSHHISESQDDRRGHDVYRPSYMGSPRSPDRSPIRDLTPEILTSSPRSCSPCPNEVDPLPSNTYRSTSIPSENRHSSIPYSPPPVLSTSTRSEEKAEHSLTKNVPSLKSEVRIFRQHHDGLPTDPEDLGIPLEISHDMSLGISNDTATNISNGVGTLSLQANKDLESSDTRLHVNSKDEAAVNAVESLTVPRTRLLASSSSPLQRVRQLNDDASSVASDVTSSSKSSLRKNRCADCKNPESSVMILIPCSTCKRRFHSSCGNPRPSLSKPSKYTCGRCLRKQEKFDTFRLPKALVQSKSLFANSDSLHLPEKEYSSQSDLRNEIMTAKVAEFDPIQSRFSDVAIKLDLPFSGHDASAEKLSASHELTKTTGDEPSSMNLSPIVYPGSDPRGAVPKVVTSSLTSVRDYAQAVRSRYKMVTCPWWKKDPSSGCALSESSCMFAHKETGLYSPDGHSPAKQWTCRKWAAGKGCPLPEDFCLYSHQDTGFYIGIDGKASKKHITCHWWKTHGRCKHAEEDCLFTHHDTGIYARDPGLSSQTNERTMAMPQLPQLCRPAGRAEEVCRPNNINRAKLDTFGFELKPTSRFSTTNATNSLEKHRELSQTSITEADGAAGSLSTFAVVNDESPLRQFSEIAHSPEKQNMEITSIAIHLDSNNEAVQDPRKRKREQVLTSDSSALPPSLTLPETGPIVSQNAPSIFDNTAFRPSMQTSESEKPTEQTPQAGSNLKKCKSCHKTIFTGNMCVSCRSPAAQTKHSFARSSVDIDVSNIMPAAPEEARSKLPDELLKLDDIILQEFETNSHPQATTTSVKQVKRKLSEDVMFASNKRPKPDPKPSWARYKPTAGSERHTSLEELTRLELEKRKGLQDAHSAANEELISPSGESNKENDQPAIVNETAHLESPTDVTPRRQSFVRVNTIEPTSARSKPLMPQLRFDCKTNILTNQDDDLNKVKQNDTLARTFIGKGLEFPSKALDDESAAQENQPSVQRDSNIRDVKAAGLGHSRTRCDECVRRHQRCSHLNKSTALKTITIETVAPAVCDECRQKHQKCLHLVDGKLDGKKCYEWLQEEMRRGTAPAGRPKAERIAIEDAARRYREAFPKPPSRGPSVSTFSEDEVTPIFHSEDEVSTAPTSNADNDSDELAFLEASAPIQFTKKRLIINVPQLKLLDVRQRSLTSLTESSVYSDAKEDATYVQSPPEDSFRARERLPGSGIDETLAIETLKRKGVIFESDSDGEADDEPIPQLGQPAPPATRSAYISDPLRQRAQTDSRDLYHLFPESRPDHGISLIRDLEMLMPRISKGQGLKNSRLVLRRGLRRNLYAHGNAHWEVEREIPPSIVTAMVEKTVPPSLEARMIDSFAPESIETRLQEITFEEFLGVSGDVEPCLIGQGAGATLGFRETTQERGLGIFGRRRRVTEIEKWPVQDRG